MAARLSKIFRRSSMPRFIAGSKATSSRIVSAVILAWRKRSSRSWRRCRRLHEIAERLGNRPRVLVHRDFQSQNIIIRNAQAHLIDFQGMRPGLAEYDLASLLFDPYVTFSRAEREELLAAYEEKRKAALQPVSPEFREIFRLCGIQRLMQALGFYGFAATGQRQQEHFSVTFPPR